MFLISLDTTRADALSVWGLPPAGRDDLVGQVTTPNLDKLARSGVRYAWAFAHAPSTLASHATVFTGRDPHDLAIARNGFPLGDGPETLAARLHKDGWATAAVLGSSALARPMGMDRGFDSWDEQFSVDRKYRHEATAAEVTDRALAVLASRDPAQPLFLFAHYYDAHGPYQAPGPGHFRTGGVVTPETIERLARRCRKGEADDPEVVAGIQQVRGAYLDEVAYVDKEVGRLLASPVGPAGRVVVVFGDHGEGLGEDPMRPFGHGGDVDVVDTHVPLIVVASGLAPKVVDVAVGLQDVAPTLLGIVGDHVPFGTGVDLGTAGQEPTFIPMEATQPSESVWPAGVARTGAGSWNNLQNERGMVRGAEVVITAPWLAEAPRWWRLGRTGNGTEEDVASADAALVPALAAWDARAPEFRSVTMDESTKAALKALGYEQ